MLKGFFFMSITNEAYEPNTTQTYDVASPSSNEAGEKPFLGLSAELLSAYDQLIEDYMVLDRQKVVDDVLKGKKEKQSFLQELRKDVEKRYSRLSAEDQKRLVNLFDARTFGYWWIMPLILDPDISDIHLFSYDNIRIKRDGKRGPSGVMFRTQHEFNTFVQYIATKNHIAIDQRNAIQRVADDTTYPYFALRYTIQTGVVTSNGQPYVVLRKFPRIKFPTMSDLVDKGMMDENIMNYLINRFRMGSILICGGNSQGKSTLLNALKETIPHDKAVLVVQQADELSTNSHPDMIFLHEVPPTSESAASYSLEVLANTALTMDVDYFIIGEIKDAEAAHLLNAAMSGQICAGTIHSSDALHALDKAADYAMKHSVYTKKELMKMFDCFKTIVYVEGFKVKQIVEIKGYNPDVGDLDYETVFSLITNDRDSFGADD